MMVVALTITAQWKKNKTQNVADSHGASCPTFKLIPSANAAAHRNSVLPADQM